MKIYCDIDNVDYSTLDKIYIYPFKMMYDWEYNYIGKKIEVYKCLFTYFDEHENITHIYYLTTENQTKIMNEELSHSNTTGYHFEQVNCCNRENKLKRILKL